MQFNSLLRPLQAARRRAALPHRKQQPCGLPRLEALEDRTVLSTLTVTSAADNGSAGTLRAVLASAQNGDVIQFANKLKGQTITLTGGQLPVNTSVTINGPGASALTISGNSAGRIFDVAAGVTSKVSGLTISQGLATDGAGILNGGSLTLLRDVLTGNVAQGITGGGPFGDGGGRGGAVENQSGATLDVINSTLSANQATGALGNSGAPGIGGGIDNEDGSVTLMQSVLTGNQVVGGPGGAPFTSYGYTFYKSGGIGRGGAISSTNGMLTISGSTVKDNTAQGGPGGSTSASGGFASGGGINSSNDVLQIDNSTLSGNQAIGPPGRVFYLAGSASGGALVMGSDIATVRGTVFADNTANGPNSATGGGVDGRGTVLQMNNCLFTGNLSEGGRTQGGGLSLFSGSGGSITNTTFIGNLSQGGLAEAVGGGLELAIFTPFTGQTITVSNCNFVNNAALSSPGATQFFDAEGGGTFISGETTATLSNCSFVQNTASAASSAPGSSSGSGAFALGGGIDVDFLSSLTLSNSTISGNQAIGGAGGSGSYPYRSSAAYGGGLNADYGSSAAISNTTIIGNRAQGGAGSAGTAGGNGRGGGVSNIDSTLTITNSTLVGNSARGGAGGAGGAGGLGQGGGIYSSTLLAFPTAVTIQSCAITLNDATGGAGGNGASGGNGEGGGLFVDAGTSGTVLSSAIIANQATGGSAGSGGSAGQGVGGGVYNLGTFNLDALSIIFANDASSSNDNTFGV